jgi:hypothetical protein
MTESETLCYTVGRHILELLADHKLGIPNYLSDTPEIFAVLEDTCLDGANEVRRFIRFERTGVVGTCFLS